jgi:4-carboxymuconolactone decarboxylase
MTAAERTLVALSAAVAVDDEESRAAAIRAAQEHAPDAAEEVILQSYLFLGYPAALRMMADWRVQTGRPAPDEGASDESEWPARGERVCATVYGGQYDRLRRNIAALHPDVERWMLVEGYGKVLGRTGLSLRVRELCIIVLLMAQTAPTQLYSHLRGAGNAGATREDIIEAFDIADGVLDGDRVDAARGVWANVIRREDAAKASEEKSCL